MPQSAGVNTGLENPDPSDGFVLVPDLNGNPQELDDLYPIATCHHQDIRWLWDLTPEHLPLLSTASKTGRKPSCRVAKRLFLMFLRYLPCYHLPARVLHRRGLGGSWLSVEQAHLLAGDCEPGVWSGTLRQSTSSLPSGLMTLCCPLSGEHHRSVGLGMRVQAEGFLAPSEFFKNVFYTD